MLRTDPAHRISASEVLHHTWISVSIYLRKGRHDRIWSLDLQLPMQSVPITTNVVSSNLD
jgi:hypothetical protein